MSVLALHSLTVQRDHQLVLDAVKLTVAAGELVGVVGANGAGKTTLLRAALGLAKPISGRAELAGRDVSRLSERDRSRLAAYLPQERHVGWNMSAWRIAALGAFDRPPAEARAAARTALARVGLEGLEDRGVLQMSGGERARVLLARLLVTASPLLVADEPTAGLDPDAQLLAMDLFREETARGAAVVLTLHDLSLAARYCDRLVVLTGGKVNSDAPPMEALSPDVLALAFGLTGQIESTPDGPRLIVHRRTAP
jgi:iron complex transport system ATP-binding protein